jgi:hypothetical protein
MSGLPTLVFTAEQGSVLWLAVRAVAFADMRDETSGSVPFHVKARQHYGAALNRMRAVIADGQEDLGSDAVLTAMLLVDNFEVRLLLPLASLWSQRLTHYLANVPRPKRSRRCPQRSN